DDGLGEVDGSDGGAVVAGAFCHLVEGEGEGGVELAEELAAGDGGGVGRAGAADEDDAGGEGVGAYLDGTSIPLSSHRPSSCYRKACCIDRFEKSLPTS